MQFSPLLNSKCIHLQTLSFVTLLDGNLQEVSPLSTDVEEKNLSSAQEIKTRVFRTIESDDAEINASHEVAVHGRTKLYWTTTL